MSRLSLWPHLPKYVSSQYLKYNSLTVEYILGPAGPWHIKTCLRISDNQYESEHWWWKVTYFSSLVLGGKITFRKKSKMHFWQKQEYHRCMPCFFFFSSIFQSNKNIHIICIICLDNCLDNMSMMLVYMEKLTNISYIQSAILLKSVSLLKYVSLLQYVSFSPFSSFTFLSPPFTISPPFHPFTPLLPPFHLPPFTLL